MKFFIFLSVVCINIATIHSLEGLNDAAKQLHKELDKIFHIAHNSTSHECSEREALITLKYNETASPLTAPAREECAKNVSMLTKSSNDCLRDFNFVECLTDMLQIDVDKMSQDCANKFNVVQEKYYEASDKERIKNQDQACYMFCIEKGMGTINEDRSFNLEQWQGETDHDVNEIIKSCTKLGDEETTECSKAARTLVCFNDKMYLDEDYSSGTDHDDY